MLLPLAENKFKVLKMHFSEKLAVMAIFDSWIKKFLSASFTDLKREEKMQIDFL